MVGFTAQIGSNILKARNVGGSLVKKLEKIRKNIGIEIDVKTEKVNEENLQQSEVKNDIKDNEYEKVKKETSEKKEESLKEKK